MCWPVAWVNFSRYNKAVTLPLLHISTFVQFKRKTVVVFSAWIHGDPRKVVYPTDSHGQFCGQQNTPNAWVEKYLFLNCCTSGIHFSVSFPLLSLYSQKATTTVHRDNLWLIMAGTVLSLFLMHWFLYLLNPSNQTPLVVSIVCFLRNKAILFYFNMLKCANPAVLINLQCPTTQVRDWVMPTLAAHFYTALCSSPTFPPRLIMQDWWAFSLRGRVASCSSVSPSALTDLQLSLMHGIPKTGNITSSSASRASRLAVRWDTVVRGLFCLFAN